MKLLQTFLKRLAYYLLLRACITVWLLMCILDWAIDLAWQNKRWQSDLAGSWEDWVERKWGKTLDYLGGYN